MKRSPRSKLRAGMLLGFLLAMLTVIPHLAAEQARRPTSQDEPSAAFCRFGAAVTGTMPARMDVIPRLGAGWYLTFDTFLPEVRPSNGAEFVHLIHVKQVKTETGEYVSDYETRPALGNRLAKEISRNPGDLWLIGNEVDRGPGPGQPPDSGQGDTLPEIYAIAYHDVTQFIKEVDPTARVAITGLVQVTPGRLQYLDLVWDAYLERYGSPMPVDVWNMHIYILPEADPDGRPNNTANIAIGTDPALAIRGSGGSPARCPDEDIYCYAEHDSISIFSEQVVAMRRWMKDHGVQNYPLILTEFSVLYPYIEEGAGCFLMDEYGQCFTPARVTAYMTNTFDYLSSSQNVSLGYPLDDYRLVQQWLWFAVNTNAVGSASNLAEADLSTLTLAGSTFQAYVAAETPVKNLVIEEVPSTVVTSSPTGTATAELAVTFRNNGNVAIDAPYAVTFYGDADLSQMIGTVQVNPGLRGCSTTSVRSTVAWSNLKPGVHPYWVVLDSQAAIDESRKTDNVGSGLVYVDPQQIMLPAVYR